MTKGKKGHQTGEEFWNTSSLDKKTTYLPSFGIGRSGRSGRKLKVRMRLIWKRGPNWVACLRACLLFPTEKALDKRSRSQSGRKEKKRIINKRRGQTTGQGWRAKETVASAHDKRSRTEKQLPNVWLSRCSVESLAAAPTPEVRMSISQLCVCVCVCVVSFLLLSFLSQESH
jgi:hypothetical protein